MIKKIWRDLTGIFGAFIAWWSMAVMVGIAMYAIWPPTGTEFVAGLSLETQNVPGNFIGFILALYAFRAITSRRSNTAGD